MFDIFDTECWDDVPSNLRNDPDFVSFGDDMFDADDTRKALQVGAILRGYSHEQVSKASDDRLKSMNDPHTQRRPRVTVQ
jgi:hypothetical protein